MAQKPVAAKGPVKDGTASRRAKDTVALKAYDYRNVNAKPPLRALQMQASHPERLVTEYAKVLAHAVATFGSRVNANAWLNKPNRVFHNQSPLQILTQAPDAVEEELVRIDHGMFA